MKKIILLFLMLSTFSLLAQIAPKVKNDKADAKREMNFDCFTPVNKIVYKENKIYKNGKKVEHLIFKDKNVLNIELMKGDNILVEGKYMELRDITEAVEEFLTNGGGVDINGKPCDYCQGRKSPESSDHPNKAYIVVTNQNIYNPAIVGVYNHIQRAYDRLCQQQYAKLHKGTKRFSDLDCDAKERFRKKYFPVNIIYDDDHKFNQLPKEPPPPPRPVFMDDDDIAISEGVEVEEEESIEDLVVPFSIVEKVPAAFGCETIEANKERKKCVAEKINTFVNEKYDKSLPSKLGLTGRQRVYCIITINSEGNVENIRIRASHKDLKNEAIRVLKLLPKFVPGMHRGVKAKVTYTMPITLN